MYKISLTMIVRDEEHNLRSCLESVNSLFDEIVVVDTGSKDRTKEIALGFGAKVVDFIATERGDYALANAHWKAVLKECPSDPDALCQLAPKSAS